MHFIHSRTQCIAFSLLAVLDICRIKLINFSYFLVYFYAKHLMISVMHAIFRYFTRKYYTGSSTWSNSFPLFHFQPAAPSFLISFTHFALPFSTAVFAIAFMHTYHNGIISCLKLKVTWSRLPFAEYHIFERVFSYSHYYFQYILHSMIVLGLILNTYNTR